MPSPFPGMNPYLEQNDTWEEFHLNFIVRTQEVLSGEVGPNYLVKVESRLYIHELSAEERRYAGRADVGIALSPATRVSSAETKAAGAPLDLVLPNVEVERYRWIEILDKRDR